LPVDTKFGYVKSSMNPADCATRGVQKYEFLKHMRWTGPDFITAKPEQWEDEFKLSFLLDEEYHCLLATSKDLRSQPPDLLDWKRYNALSSCQSIAYVLRFIKGVVSRVNVDLKKRIEQKIPEISQMTTAPYVTAKEREMATRVLIKNHQQVHLSDLGKKTLRQLKLRIDNNGILRCRGRLEKANLAYGAHLAKIIVQEAHTNLHCGIAHTMANVIQTCVACQKMNNLPLAYPDMKDLPECRVRRTRSFGNVGIDFFGLIAARKNGEVKKFYGIILTCTTTRLLHLELTADMSTTSVLLALRRFFARRGVPATIISDNGPAFVLGDEIVKDAIASISNDTVLAKQWPRKGFTNEDDEEYFPRKEIVRLRTHKQAEEALRSSHQHTERFWTIWCREYLTSLREKHQLNLRGKKGGNRLSQVGNIVLLVDQILPRNSWKIGRITRLKESSDGEIREAEVKVPNGRLSRRPINLLVPLELEGTDDQG
uniref:Integrase catalytic domain-containing protein n=1 Tax=Heligmosomoides polygyrus TaxID=6339 RepID=A0A183F2C9_HELPZ